MAHGTSRCWSSNYLDLDSFVLLYVEYVVNAGVNVVVDDLRYCYQDSTFRVYISVHVITVLAFVLRFVLVACWICHFSQNSQMSSRSVWCSGTCHVTFMAVIR
jgi:hypothetical protein